MTGIVIVPGTYGWSGPDTQGQWWQPGSPLLKHLAHHGIVLVDPARPFVWTTGLGGVWPWRRHADWAAGGAALAAYLQPVEAQPGVRLLPSARLVPTMRRVVTHSHGLQVALYAAASGCRIDTLLSIAGPIRADMRDVAIAARPLIRRWLHVAGDADCWQWWGELFDGHVGIERFATWRGDDGQIVAQADHQVVLPEMAHASLVQDPRHFHEWADQGLLDLLKG
jgi:hypothetical protein